MSNEIKAIFKIHTILLICFLISAIGVAIMNYEYAKMYAAITIFVIPLSAIVFMFLQSHKESLEGENA